MNSKGPEAEIMKRLKTIGERAESETTINKVPKTKRNGEKDYIPKKLKKRKKRNTFQEQK